MTLPSILGPDDPIAFSDGVVFSASAFRESAASLAGRLASMGHVVNLCANRYRFLVAFAAAILRRQTTLLPPSHAPSAVTELAAAYPDSVTVQDAAINGSGSVETPGLAEPSLDFVAVIGHTSGSTGKPTAHSKSWGGLCSTAALNASTIRAAIGESAAAHQPWIVATVPPQHMYGLEMSVLLPLLAGFGIHGGRPLLPADVARTLEEVPAPRILVSTPVHLRSLIESGVSFPDIAVVISATAPLHQDLARRVEHHLRAVLIEMFGSTETCVIATRRTAQDACWRSYPGIRLEPVKAGTIVRAPWFASDQLLQDIIEIGAERSFTVVGRHGDLVEVAGKRASLADLTRRLSGLSGVQDAIVFQLPAKGGGVRRCAALVVAPGLSAREVLQRFRLEVDAAFLPRPLVIVSELPRNELGKLPLDFILRQLRKVRGD